MGPDTLCLRDGYATGTHDGTGRAGLQQRGGISGGRGRSPARGQAPQAAFPGAARSPRLPRHAKRGRLHAVPLFCRRPGDAPGIQCPCRAAASSISSGRACGSLSAGQSGRQAKRRPSGRMISTIQPRVCGDYRDAGINGLIHEDTTPRVRGLRAHLDAALDCYRYNPACAGTTMIMYLNE